jgi:hypothetical protein
MGEMTSIQNSSLKMKERGHLENKDVDGGIMLQ